MTKKKKKFRYGIGISCKPEMIVKIKTALPMGAQKRIADKIKTDTNRVWRNLNQNMKQYDSKIIDAALEELRRIGIEISIEDVKS